jgi:hypothetical protein
MPHFQTDPFLENFATGHVLPFLLNHLKSKGGATGATSQSLMFFFFRQALPALQLRAPNAPCQIAGNCAHFFFPSSIRTDRTKSWRPFHSISKDRTWMNMIDL